MHIRTIELKDAENYLALSKRIDSSGYMLFEPEEKNISIAKQQEMIEQIIQTKTTELFVAEVDESLIGFIMAIGGTVKRKRHSAYIVIGVDEPFRGKGVATKLFKRLFEWAKEMKLTRLELTVMKTNTEAYRLYRNLGFTVEGEKIHSLLVDGKLVNEYYLYKLL